jgi:hypothetical protein
MNGNGRFVEPPVTSEEAQAARRLAEAIDGGATVGADPEELAVVRLLEAVSGAAASDEIAARRLRNELTARASRRRRLGTARRIAAVAAAVAGVTLLSVFLLRSSVRPSESVLVAREEAARAVVVEVAGAWQTRYEPSRRIAAVSEEQWRLRFADQLDSERFQQLATESSADSTNDRGQATSPSTRTIPTPGGSS